MVSFSGTYLPGVPVNTRPRGRAGQEALDLARRGHGQLVFRRQFVHAQDGDDVAQFLVALQRACTARVDAVVLLADDDAGRGWRLVESSGSTAG